MFCRTCRAGRAERARENDGRPDVRNQASVSDIFTRCTVPGTFNWSSGVALERSVPRSTMPGAGLGELMVERSRRAMKVRPTARSLTVERRARARLNQRPGTP
jgi:hypothetical protein